MKEIFFLQWISMIKTIFFINLSIKPRLTPKQLESRVIIVRNRARLRLALISTIITLDSRCLCLISMFQISRLMHCVVYLLAVVCVPRIDVWARGYFPMTAQRLWSVPQFWLNFQKLQPTSSVDEAHAFYQPAMCFPNVFPSLLEVPDEFERVRCNLQQMCRSVLVEDKHVASAQNVKTSHPPKFCETCWSIGTSLEKCFAVG